MRGTTARVTVGLTVAAGALAVFGSALAGPAQAATTTSVTTYFHTISAQHSGDGLAVNRGVTNNGEPIVAWPKSSEQQNTQFTLEGAGASPAAGYSGRFVLQARHSGQCIDIAGAAVSDSGSATFRYVYNYATGLPSSSTARVMKVANGGASGTAVILAKKDLVSSLRFAIQAPYKVTTTLEVTADALLAPVSAATR